MRDSLGVALDGDRSGEAVDGESAVELWERVAHRLLGPVVCCEEGDGGEDEEEQDESGAYFDEKGNAAGARGGAGELFVGGAVKESDWFGGFGLVRIHALI